MPEHSNLAPQEKPIIIRWGLAASPAFGYKVALPKAGFADVWPGLLPLRRPTCRSTSASVRQRFPPSSARKPGALKLTCRNIKILAIHIEKNASPRYPTGLGHAKRSFAISYGQMPRTWVAQKFPYAFLTALLCSRLRRRCTPYSECSPASNFTKTKFFTTAHTSYPFLPVQN